MPYRVDWDGAEVREIERLIDAGALDVELFSDGNGAALVPDQFPPDAVGALLGRTNVRISPAASRDDGSVWVLRPRPVRVGPLTIVPAGADAPRAALQLIDSAAFGTGLHPTTALCLEALLEILARERPSRALDIGSGSGVLALATLKLGVEHAVAVDRDEGAVRATRENARINDLERRLDVRLGGPEIVSGMFPLVLANIVAAPLIELAPVIVRLIASGGHLVLSGIPASIQPDVSSAYRRVGLREMRARFDRGWVALVFRPSW